MPKVRDIESIYDRHHPMFKDTPLFYFPNRLIQKQRIGSPFKVAWRHPDGKTETVTFEAEVGQANWLVRCRWCQSAHYVAKADPWFYCANPQCQNEPADHNAVLVHFPDELEEVEELLSLRSRYQLRNWVPGEPLGRLVFENAQLGIPPAAKWKKALSEFLATKPRLRGQVQPGRR